jgi:hypothetical protein
MDFQLGMQLDSNGFSMGFKLGNEGEELPDTEVAILSNREGEEAILRKRGGGGGDSEEKRSRGSDSE